MHNAAAGEAENIHCLRSQECRGEGEASPEKTLDDLATLCCTVQCVPASGNVTLVVSLRRFFPAEWCPGLGTKNRCAEHAISG